MLRIIFFRILLALFSCSSVKFEGYEENENGLIYKFHTKAGDTAKPAVGDYVFIRMINKFTDDSILFNSWLRKPDGIVSFNLRQPAFHGSIEDAIMSMSIGDSASFKISADSIYALIPKEDSAKAFPPGTYFTFEIKLMNVMTAMEMQEEQRKKYEAYMAQVQEKSAYNKENGKKIISDYVAQNKISEKATKSGLIYIEHEKGKGKAPAFGSMVMVNYIGRLLEDGTVFDASNGQPLEFSLGKDPMIKGFHEGIALMRLGGKATIILPSELGYDSLGSVDPRTGMYGILPYAPLLFEVELVGIK